MYIAKENIDVYKKGDVVPKDKAEVWAKMYKESPVEIVEGEEPKQEASLDLNGDGKVDKKDSSIAGKVLAAARGRKKTSKRKTK